MESPGDRPVFDPGDIIESPNGDLCVKIIDHIGEGRCCMVYSATTIRDNSKVALKVFKKGPTYDGAVQREQYILDIFNDPKHNIVSMYGQFTYKGLHCQLLELLECNIRSVIFKNERQGLSPWATQKFARDVLIGLKSLHEKDFAHADLKPANIMWSSHDGRFKLLDFGLTFHADEDELHQIQSPGYKAPEAAEWNKYKDDLKKKRKRKLQGTYSDLTKAAPAYSNGLQKIGVQSTGSTPPTSSTPAESPIPSGASRTILRAPPRRHRLSGVPPGVGGSSDRESIIVLEEYQRHGSRRGSNQSVTSQESKAIAEAAAAVSAACNKWLSESSGIFTASTQTGSSTNSVPANQEEAISTTTVFTSTTASTVLSSVSSSVAYVADEEEEDGQEWRRGRTRSKSKFKPPRPTSVCAAIYEKERPFMPNISVDMWAFGCLLAEVFSGSKMFSATDKMASVLKPHQLLEMRLGATEMQYHENGHQIFFNDAKDLIMKCLDEDPYNRISAQDALDHRFFKNHSLMPTTKDMVILPSHILQLFNVFNSEKCDDPKELEDAIRDIRNTAEQYGQIVGMTAKNGHAYIEFQEASDCQEACSALSGKKFDEQIVFAVFYPISLWNQKIYI